MFSTSLKETLDSLQCFHQGAKELILSFNHVPASHIFDIIKRGDLKAHFFSNDTLYTGRV